MTDPLLITNHLSRNFGEQCAVNNISFSINKGEVMGFLGPNGAGKTTTMKMLSGNLAPHHGEIIINGHDLLKHPKLAKENLGYLPQQPPLYMELTVVEYLVFCAQIKKIKPAKIKVATDSVIERCGLTKVTQRLIANLSKGYQQRLGIAQAIIHNPAVVILDEPTSGLDPIQIREIRHLIREIATEHSVILSTHILSEVQMLCDRVQIINQGQLIFSDTLDRLGQSVQTATLLICLLSPPQPDVLKNIAGVNHIEQLNSSQFRLHYQPSIDPRQQLLTMAVSQHWQLTELRQEQHSLEDVFTNLVQNEMED